VIAEDELLARFERVERQRDGDWLVRCRAHADGGPSLHVTRARDRWLLHCLAGCSLEDVLRAAGLEARDLFVQNGAGPPIVATYPYTDERGELLFQVVRREGKRFTQRRPDGDGGWVWRLDRVRRVLYRLPRVIEAVANGETIYVVEGEEDVHALEATGKTATTNPGGAGKWREEYATVLTGARVIVVADRDGPGRKHAADVAKALEGVAANVWTVEAVEGKDARDHLRAGHPVEAFTPVATGGPKSRQEIPLVDMEAAMELAGEAIDYVIAARGVLTVLVGRHSSFKTFLMMLAGHAVHRGDSEIAGLACSQRTVLYLDGENGPRVMGKRFRDAGIPADGMLVADATGIVLPRDIAKVKATIEATGAGLVVLDSLRRLAVGARENLSDDMAPLVAAVAQLARELDVPIVLIHHRSSKSGAGTVRGSSAIEDQADLIFSLERVDGDPVRNRRRLRAEKFRLAESPRDMWVSIGPVLDFKAEGGSRVELAAAEPKARGDDEDDGQSMPDYLAGRIRALADQVREDGGWPPSRLAAAVGRQRDDGTFKRALGVVLAEGWTAAGEGKARRVHPPRTGPPGQPLGDDPVGPVACNEVAQSRLDFEVTACRCSEWTARMPDDTCQQCGRPKP
jgi:5S rRNA maturation endonuclease (ribonuclease M5)